MAIAAGLSDGEVADLYETLMQAVRFHKSRERMEAALHMSVKPDAYSPLTQRLIAHTARLGDLVHPSDTVRPA